MIENMWNDAQKSERSWWKSITKAQQKNKKNEEKKKIVRSALKIQEAIDNIGVESFRVLDVGCGPTIVSRYLNSTEKVAVDPLIDFYSKTFLLPRPKYDYIKCLAEALPFQNDIFDLIVCRNVLDHTISPKLILQNLENIRKRRLSSVVC